MPRRVGDDRYVKRAYKFNMRLRRNDPKAELRLEHEQPDLYQAFKIYETTNTPIRWLLEAGVMADQKPQDLADYLNMDATVIEVYEKIFFDVRDVLANPGCIYSNVLGHGLMHVDVPLTPDVLWKMLAYDGGWDVVQAIFQTGRIPPAVMDYYRQGFMNNVIKNGVFSTKSARFNSHNAADHARLTLDLVRQEEELGSARSGDTAHMAMGSLLKSIQLTVLPTRTDFLAEEPRLQQVVLPAPKPIEEEKK